MGKTSKNKRRRLLASAETALPISPDSDGEGGEGENDKSFLLGLVSPAELAITVRTLSTLTKNTELLNRKNELKSLRGAVFDFQRVSASLAGTGNTLTSRISAALSSSRHTDALVLLSELRLRKLVPKLGALQRWVRDCDAASRSDGSYGDSDVLRVLDAILRSTIEGGSEDEPVKRMDEWRMRDLSGENVWDEVYAGTFPAEADKAALAAPFSLLQSTPGPARLPPNHHPALLFASSPSAIPLAATPATPVTHHPVPSVPGAFLLADVLSLDECKSIIGAAEAVGFAPDQPVGDSEGASVLAHNLYWLADQSFLDTFWSRLAHLLPQEVSGGRVQGLNARFRVYRYVPGAIYRPHIDGAWPKSGVDPTTGEYLYDSSPADKPQWSRLTFLIYLNDSFTSGHTTFFLPSPSTPGQLAAYPVKPLAGCALVFPHGDTVGSLLHEGSPVGEGGAKYVIRTDVLYEVGGGGRKRKVLDGAEGEGAEMDDGEEV
ncbi:hypothetical protein RQP46_002606 [Phenoliferia psychrophenolica]